MLESARKRVEELADAVDYGQVVITIKAGRIVNIQLNQSFDMKHEQKNRE